MATRMATLLFGSVRDEQVMLPPPGEVPAGEAQVVRRDPDGDVTGAAASTPPPPARTTRPWPALPAMTLGLLWTAVVWLGLAMFVIALAYPFSIGARFWLLTAATWLMAGGIAYAFTARPEMA